MAGGIEEVLSLTLNAEELLQELETVENKADEVEDTVEQVKEAAEISMGQVLGMVSAGWLATQGMVRAAGGTISTVFRTVIGTTLGAIATLTPIFAAQASTGDWIRAAMGMASIGLALSALAAMQADEKQLSDQLRGANMALHGIQSMLGGFNWY